MDIILHFLRDPAWSSVSVLIGVPVSIRLAHKCPKQAVSSRPLQLSHKKQRKSRRSHKKRANGRN